MSIHPTAIVVRKENIHPSVEVGPYSFIGPDVKIAEGNKIGANCHIEGFTEIGPRNIFSPFVSIGCPPQDFKYSGQKTYLKIGEGNHFREFVTVHIAVGEGNATIIGNNNLFMAYVHIAHNCVVGNNITMANAATLAGHVHVGDRAVIGGMSGIHQFCHIGRFVMIGGMSKIVKDVPPFVKIDGNPARVVGINGVGLRRNEVPKESIEAIKKMYKQIFRSNLNLTQGLKELENLPIASDPYVQEFIEFVRHSKRGIHKRSRESLDPSE